jgi:multidrug transporter EmrE-like cation transporter
MTGEINRAAGSRSASDFIYIFAVIFLTVYGQLILKWQVTKAGSYPASFPERIVFLVKLAISPWIISGLLAGILSLLSWMAAMTKFELSYAYPFMSLAFVLVLLSSAVFFNETISPSKVVGICFIILGIIISSR